MNIIEYENYREQKQHGNFVFPYTTYLCSIPLDFMEVPAHWHDEIEIIYVKKGMGTVNVDFKQYTVTAPSIVLIFPGQLHSIAQFENERMEYENIIFHQKIFEGAKSDSTFHDFILPILNRKFSIPAVFTPDTSDFTEVSAPIDACDEICKTTPKGYPLYIKSQLFQLFFFLFHRFRKEASDKQKEKKLEKIKPVLKYIENHYQEKVTIGELAAEIGFSEAHFMRFFKEILGTPFTSYLNDYRLTMAARLLSISDSTVLEISELVGFQNLSHFNRAFKKKYAITPTEYRKQST